MIYITGDCHSKFQKFSMKIFPEQKEMTKEDFVIIAGDFGGVWKYKGEDSEERNWLNWLENKSFTTLFVDGNHEDHARLQQFPIKEFHGGKVHEIRPSVLHLMRGEVFELQGQKFFTFGGARSHDMKDGLFEPGDRRIKLWQYDYTKEFRVNRQNWWEEEMPSKEEMQYGLENLKKHGNKVDVILSHCVSSSIQKKIKESFKIDELTEYFEQLEHIVDYNYWICGHYHVDQKVDEKHFVLYDQIVPFRVK